MPIFFWYNSPVLISDMVNAFRGSLRRIGTDLQMQWMLTKQTHLCTEGTQSSDGNSAFCRNIYGALF